MSQEENPLEKMKGMFSYLADTDTEEFSRHDKRCRNCGSYKEVDRLGKTLCKLCYEWIYHKEIDSNKYINTNT
jgi:hypothetical protein